MRNDNVIEDFFPTVSEKKHSKSTVTVLYGK